MGSFRKGTVSFQDFANNYKQNVVNKWITDSDNLPTSSTFPIFPINKNNKNQPTLNRRQQTIMTRLRIGHTAFSHEYLMKQVPRPSCPVCNCPVTVEHVLLHCKKFNELRRRHLLHEASDLKDMLLNFMDNILKFIKETNLKI